MNTSEPYILMLEDDNDDRHITQLFFAEKGHKINFEFLADANEVMRWLQQRAAVDHRLPELIILDRNIPVGNSMEALKQVKEHPVFKMIPVVMISGTPIPADVKESYRLGANSFIHKPFNSEDTAKTIGNFINYWLDTVILPVNSPVATMLS